MVRTAAVAADAQGGGEQSRKTKEDGRDPLPSSPRQRPPPGRVGRAARPPPSAAALKVGRCDGVGSRPACGRVSPQAQGRPQCVGAQLVPAGRPHRRRAGDGWRRVTPDGAGGHGCRTESGELLGQAPIPGGSLALAASPARGPVGPPCHPQTLIVAPSRSGSPPDTSAAQGILGGAGQTVALCDRQFSARGPTNKNTSAEPIAC